MIIIIADGRDQFQDPRLFASAIPPIASSAWKSLQQAFSPSNAASAT
jgi:hypothetical protein